MKFRQWMWFVSVFWTAILFALALFLPDGGIANSSNWGALGFYCCTLFVIIPAAMLARWLERREADDAAFRRQKP